MLEVGNVMSKKKITYASFASLLGISEKTAKNKVSGRTEFTYSEAQKIKTIFPEYDLDFLMSSESA